MNLLQSNAAVVVQFREKGKRMLALLVTIKIKPGNRDVFVEALLNDARGSVNDEPGCLRFDVLRALRRLFHI